MKLKILEPSFRKRKSSFTDFYETDQRAQTDFLHSLDLLPYEEALDTGEKKVEEILVRYTIGSPQGSYQVINGKLEWLRPGEENANLEISVSNPGGDRIFSNLVITASLSGTHGETIGIKNLPFVWNPWQATYNADWYIPYDGVLQLHLEIRNPERIPGCPESIEMDFKRVYIAAQSFQ